MCGLVASVCAVAQNLDFKIVTSTQPDGVNIRKSPSATAPKAIFSYDDITDYQAPLSTFTRWATSVPAGYEADKFVGPGIVAARTDGWIEVEGIGPKGTSGWVSAKYCKVSSPRPITSGFIRECGTIYSRKMANGEIYCLVMEPNEMDGEVHFYGGMLSDGKIVCPDYLYCMEYIDAAESDFGCEDGNCTLEAPGCDEGLTMDKLSEATIDKIMGALTRQPRLTVFFLDENGTLESTIRPEAK